MSSKAVHILSAGLWAMTAAAQQPPVGSLVAPLPGAHAQPERAWLEFAKSPATVQPTVCSIPLIRVPVSKNVERMPKLRPRKPVGPMPLVPLPAPPCEEEKR